MAKTSDELRKLHDASLKTMPIFGRVAASGDLFNGNQSMIRNAD